MHPAVTAGAANCLAVKSSIYCVAARIYNPHVQEYIPVENPFAPCI